MSITCLPISSNDESINFHYDLFLSSSNFISPSTPTPTLPHHLAPEHFEPGVSSREQLHLLPPVGRIHLIQLGSVNHLYTY